MTCAIVTYTGWMMMQYPPTNTDEVALLTSTWDTSLDQVYKGHNQERPQVVMDLSRR